MINLLLSVFFSLPSPSLYCLSYINYCDWDYGSIIFLGPLYLLGYSPCILPWFPKATLPPFRLLLRLHALSVMHACCLAFDWFPIWLFWWFYMFPSCKKFVVYSHAKTLIDMKFPQCKVVEMTSQIVYLVKDVLFMIRYQCMCTIFHIMHMDNINVVFNYVWL